MKGKLYFFFAVLRSLQIALSMIQLSKIILILGSQMSKERQKLGLVLEGGGVKGAYQIGALMAIRELMVDFDGVAGTSIGAINGAIYLEGGYSKLFDVWNEIKTNTVFDLSDEELAELNGLDLRPAILRILAEKKLNTFKMLESSYQKSQKFFETIVNEDDIRSSGKDFGLVAFNISDMQPFEKMMSEIDEGKLVDYIIASATFPIFPPKVIDEKKYIDGGVYDNMPVNLLTRHGYDKMLVIRTNVESKQPKRQVEGNPNLFYIVPKEDLGPAMAFSKTRIHSYMQMGYDDTKELMQNGLSEFLLG